MTAAASSAHLNIPPQIHKQLLGGRRQNEMNSRLGNISKLVTAPGTANLICLLSSGLLSKKRKMRVAGRLGGPVSRFLLLREIRRNSADEQDVLVDIFSMIFMLAVACIIVGVLLTV